MRQELARTAENPVPTTPFSEPSLNALRRAMGWMSGKPTLMTGFTMSAEDHCQIASSISTFRRQIFAGPSDKAAIGIEIAKLLTAFPTQEQGDISAAMRVDAYADALGAAPAWAVREARLKIFRGEAADIDKRFAPTPPQFASIVNSILKPFRDDLSDLEALGKIEPEFAPSEDERARIAQGFDAFRAGLAETGTRNEKDRSARARDAIEEANKRFFDRGREAFGEAAE